MAEEAPAPHSPWLGRLVVPALRLFVTPMLLLLGPVRVHGRKRIPRRGGLLILSNHLADIDPVIVQYACPRLIHFMAKSELFGMRFIAPLMKLFRAFPVRRGEPDRTSMRHAVKLLESGEVVAVFPEGQLSESGELQPLKAGIALIVRMAGASVICVGLRDTNRILPYGSIVPRPALRKVVAHWGQPKQFSRDATAEEILGWTEGELRRLTGQAGERKKKA